ncbi:MAG TPA: hypothetical protein VFE62_03005 [Gemmataceae bacterium]|nr:hypothetical protein [Gemmataceae bacterium]
MTFYVSISYRPHRTPTPEEVAIARACYRRGLRDAVAGRRRRAGEGKNYQAGYNRGRHAMSMYAITSFDTKA